MVGIISYALFYTAVCKTNISHFLEISNGPLSQTIKLGETATFHCSATAVSSYSFEVVIDTTFRDMPIYISRLNVESINPVVRDWMSTTIDREPNEQGYTYTASVTIMGSERTNGSTITCRIFRFGGDSIFSNAAILTVIGKWWLRLYLVATNM